MNTKDMFHDEPIDTPFGILQACWSATGLFSFGFVRDKETDMGAGLDVRRGGSLRRAMALYQKTAVFVFAFDSLDLRDLSEFSVIVLRLCHQIPAGQTRTYGQLAKQAGSPIAARAVGMVMAKNRWPLLVPCHRVVGSDGKMTGYSGVGGIATKKRLLDFERGLLGLDLF